jgi:hypothetical protein
MFVSDISSSVIFAGASAFIPVLSIGTTHVVVSQVMTSVTFFTYIPNCEGSAITFKLFFGTFFVEPFALSKTYSSGSCASSSAI